MNLSRKKKKGDKHPHEASTTETPSDAQIWSCRQRWLQITASSTSAPVGYRDWQKGLLAAWNRNFSWAGSLDCTPLASSEHCKVSSSSWHLNTTASLCKGSLPDRPWLTETGSRSPYTLSFRAFQTLSSLCFLPIHVLCISYLHMRSLLWLNMS